ncbi:MAG: ATPase central domain protein [Herbinix sp.]|jgi:AAA+ superfamily predicted ATPase|nr:ATPase central domain protein [Herbinix sp.]
MSERSIIEQVIQKLSFVYGKKPIIFFVTEDINFIDRVVVESNDLYLFENCKEEFKKIKTIKGAFNYIDIFRDKETFEMEYKRSDGDPAKYYYCKNAHLHMMGGEGQNHNLKLYVSLLSFLEKRDKITDKACRDRTVLFLSAPELAVPKGLESFIEVIEVPLPNIKDIERILTSYINVQILATGDILLKEHIKILIQSLRGLNISQIHSVFSYVEDEFPTLSRMTADMMKSRWEDIGSLFHEQILHQKQQTVMMNSMIKFIEVKKGTCLKGNENILGAIAEVKDIYRDPGSFEGCKPPKGVLMAGVPGTGKSLLVEKIASDMDVPLLQLDMGSVMGKYIGESENKLRRALELAQAVAPCILFIDELEKAFPTGGDEHEVTKRLFGYMLWWMQDNKKPILIYATANDTNKINSAFLRSGRFDRKFYTFMPSSRECIDIIKVRLEERQKNNRKLFDEHLLRRDHDFERILNCAANSGKFYTGADIESWVNETMIKIYQNKSQRNAIISSEVFLRYFELTMEDTRPYGKTNLNNLVHYWLQIKFNGYLPAGDEIIRTGDFDLANRPDKMEEGVEPASYFVTERLPVNFYDRKLYQVITDEINRLSKDRIIREYITNVQKG